MPASPSDRSSNPHTRRPLAASLFALSGALLLTALLLSFAKSPFSAGGLQVQAAPQEVTLTRRFPLSADAYVISSRPDANSGDELFLEIGSEPGLSPSVQSEIWMAADLSTIPLGASLQAAMLRLPVRAGGYGGRAAVVLYPVTSMPWDEATLTWESRPARDTTYPLTGLFDREADALTIDVSELVAMELGGDLTMYGYVLQSDPAAEDWLGFLHSRESESPPELVVTYTVPGQATVFTGAVQQVGFGPPEEYPVDGATVALYGSGIPRELGTLLTQARTDAGGAYYLYTVSPIEPTPLTYTLVYSDADQALVNVSPGEGGATTEEGNIRYPDTTSPGLYADNLFQVEPATWPDVVTRVFSGQVFYPGGEDPVPGVEVVLYGAEVPGEPLQVLAGASTGEDGGFRLPVTLPPEGDFTYYALQVADDAFDVLEAFPGAGGTTTEAGHILFEAPPPGDYAGNRFDVVAVEGGRAPAGAQQMETRPVVAVLLTPQCTCGATDCTTITNANVLTAFGETLFNATGDSVHNYFVENSQGAFGLQQAGLFQVVPGDDPATTKMNESDNCAPGFSTPEQHRAYVARYVLGTQLNFDFGKWDADGDGTVEEDELIVLLTVTDSHTGNARTRVSDPQTVNVNGVNVRVNYNLVQPGTDFYTIAHEVAHALPYPGGGGEPGDMYGGAGNPGTYGLMDNHCHGRINILNPNVPYTPTQHILSRRPHLDPWNKIELGWITPTVVSGSGGWYSLDPVETVGGIVKLQTPAHGAKEYFLVENRWAAGSQYETQLPDSGLAIWHIDEDYLPDQRRAIALERAGGGANSGAASAYCNDDQDTTALYDASRSFYNDSAPAARWSDGTDSNVAALCIGPPGQQVPVYLSASFNQTVLPQDAAEPNDTPALAGAVTPGVYNYTLHAPCDTDLFTYTHWQGDALTVTVNAYYDAAHTQPAPAPQVTLSEDNFYTTDTAQGNGSASLALPFKGMVTIQVSGSNAAVYYRMQVASGQAAIPPDRFDDQKPAGEVRNDSLATSAVITAAIDANAVLIPGLQIDDLNLEKAADVDYFTIQLPAEGQECLAAGDPRLNDPDVTQGALTIQVYPYFKRAFTIETYRSDGLQVTNHTLHGPLSVRIECPHDVFADGKVTLQLDDPSGGVNFYTLDIYYNRWNQYKEFPDWLLLTDPPLFREIPVLRDWVIRWVYPFTPWLQEALLGGGVTDPLPPEYLPFHWEQAGPLVLDLRTLPGQELNLRLYDADHNLIGEAGPLSGVTAVDEEIPREPWRLSVADLPAGVYALGVDGAEGITEYLLTFVSVSEAQPRVYLPILLR